MQRFEFNRWYGLRLVIGAFAVAGFVLVSLIPTREMPFDLHLDRTGGVIEARPLTPLPSGLRVGDRVVLAQQTLQTRAALVYENVPGTDAYSLRVQRTNRALSVSVRSIERAEANGQGSMR